MLKQDGGARGIQSAVGSALAHLPITPNQWTALSVLVALAAAGAIALAQNIAAGAALFLVAGLIDMVDGAVARARGESSALGGFIDGVADRFVEALFLISFMFVPLPAFIIDARIWLACAVFLGTSMPSFIRAYADHKGVVSREEALAMGGLFERAERVLLVVAGLGAGMFLGLEFFVYAVALACALSSVTIIQRLYAIICAQPKEAR